MQAFTLFTGLAAPIDRSNVDTDALIPKQFMKSISRANFGQHLFDEWRFLDKGYPGINPASRQPNPDFSLNMPRYQGARILITQDNFGCGSSREHAVWALEDFGIRVIIAPSFAEIFYANCFKNGILPVVQGQSVIDQLMTLSKADTPLHLRVNLPDQQIDAGVLGKLNFEIDEFYKHRLINGLDDIGITLAKLPALQTYEEKRKALEPWLFVD